MSLPATPKVSVIMAAYNMAHLIESSIRSVLKQTCTNFELLVYDDCSTDDTYDCVLRLAATDSRIKLLRGASNQGQAAVRNLCFQQARGVYIAIQDADDYAEPERLARQAAFLDKQPAYAAVGSLCRMQYDDGTMSVHARGKSGDIMAKDFLFGMPFPHATTMFRSQALQTLQGYTATPDTRFRNEDYDLFMRMYAMKMRCYVLEEPLYRYYEGQAAYKRRKYRYRWAEAKVRYNGFRAMGLMPAGLPYVIKPLLVGLIPQRIMEWRRMHMER